MKKIELASVRAAFKPVLASASLQAAVMVLPPGESSSDQIMDEHPRSEQWLLVTSGTGRARTRTRSVPIKTGSLLLIEKNEPHQVTNTGSTPLVTLNFYCPPAYSKSGEVRPSVKR